MNHAPEDLPEGIRRGIDLFNRRAFFECHDAIEEVWLGERGEVGLLYQGILQVAVGFYHAGNGNWNGALSLLGKGLAKLEKFPARCRGIDVAGFVAATSRCEQELRALGPDRMREMDTALIPVIRYFQDE